MRTPALALLATAIALPASAQTASPSAAKADNLSATVRTLASDPFEGRGPGTPGEARTVDYLVKRLKALGLQPGGEDGKWTQVVPMVHTQVDPAGKLKLRGAGDVALRQGDNINLTTVKDTDRVTLEDAPLVFVGYGTDAPEAGWDDYKGVDLHGKIAVFLVNDPDFAAKAGDDAAGRFGDRRMTYYGRWTYKFDQAAERGAAAALIIHDTDAAGYGWSTVSASNGENYDIVRGPDENVLPLQGWVRGDTAQQMFAAAGLDLAALRKKARSADFSPVTLTGVSLDADLPVTTQHIRSRNVLGRIAGTTHPDETVMYGAHWDAYGKGKPDAQGRAIRPGANDDALGVAAVLETARMFKQAARPERSVVFALWTGEERGLLGSEYYAVHPVYPLETTVADLTFDILQTAGPARNLVLIGKGNSTLDDVLAPVAAAQGRKIVPETFSERGLFFRADHFSVARRGVPSLLMMALGGPPDLEQGGLAAGQTWLDAYMECYHQTCDSWSADWNLKGAAEDVEAFYKVGHRLANSRAWPEWRPDFAFAEVRRESADARRH
ncbi:M20/M25/M40 family metallo-hydrolase [Stakelama saccharophila]|uniref:M20/M25/M40 family metallo-hydrolase n=1 Tax=Stakelama saccharophila TaxID=3075605 RepID=A0ABZ0B6Q3_9SPHN|nr:M20/M25/M40 family metallo-hydrolase [Stakelama sp. W311]WNO52887.1 M20/M25/M40 family metallo-hydrolase [Stakelama sp. W311]